MLLSMVVNLLQVLCLHTEQKVHGGGKVVSEHGWSNALKQALEHTLGVFKVRLAGALDSLI